MSTGRSTTRVASRGRCTWAGSCRLGSVAACSCPMRPAIASRPRSRSTGCCPNSRSRYPLRQFQAGWTPCPSTGSCFEARPGIAFSFSRVGRTGTNPARRWICIWSGAFRAGERKCCWSWMRSMCWATGALPEFKPRSMRWPGSPAAITAGSGPAWRRGRCVWGPECGSELSFNMTPGQEALARLREGNRRFVENGAASGGRPGAGQQPFAIVLGSSDCDVPAELIFGQGFGDLFVIRVAGNIVAPSQVGSVEFAAERFETRLAVVLGHTQCGAVAATLEELRQPQGHASPNLRAIVDRIRPAIEPLFGTAAAKDPAALAAEATRANIRASVAHLRHGSALLERRIERDGLLIVGAEYCVAAGTVEVFDD